MTKRYRRPKVFAKEIKLQKGKIDGVEEMCLYFGDDIPRCDRSLIFSYICFENFNYTGGERKSLVQELEERGYDIDTLRFSIRKNK